MFQMNISNYYRVASLLNILHGNRTLTTSRQRESHNITFFLTSTTGSNYSVLLHRTYISSKNIIYKYNLISKKKFSCYNTVSGPESLFYQIDLNHMWAIY